MDSTVSCLRDSAGSGWSLVALTVFKTVRDLTLSGWVGSIPMHSRQRAWRSRTNSMPNSNRLLRLVVSLVVALVASTAAQAQRPDSARRAPVVPTARVDSLNPPISPRRAFLYSFLAPGYSQSRLGRNKAATTFMFVEGIALVMIRESAADVHEARRMASDSVIVSYVNANGTSGITRVPPRFDDKYIHTREAHVEDWVALLVANHLFAGADAYVAAHLWDVPIRLGLRATPNGTAISAALAW